MNCRLSSRSITWLAVVILAPAGGIVWDSRAAAYADAVLAERPLAYWRLNEPGAIAPVTAVNLGSLGLAGSGIYWNAPAHLQPGALRGDADPAVLFDGISQKLDVPYVDGLNPAGAFTVELWVQPSGGQGLIRSPLSSRDLSAGGGSGYAFFTTLGGQWEFRTHLGAAVNRVVGGTVGMGTWTHLVGLHDGTATRLFVNGAPVGFSVTNGCAPNRRMPLRIGAGANEGSGSFFWPGVIDEVAIYPEALPAARVAAHFQAATDPAPPMPYGQVVQADNPAGYWRLNDPPGAPLTRATNSGSLGPAADGTYQTGANPAGDGPRPPEFVGFEPDNRACVFDGANGYVSTMAGLLNRRGALTVTGWLRRDGVQTVRAGLFGQNDLFEFGYANDATLLVRDGGSSTNLSVPNAFPDGRWHHVAVVFGGSLLALYTNAVLAASAGNLTAASVANNYGFNLGGGGVLDATGNFFKGALDEVAVFDRALGPDRIAAHFHAATSAGPRILVPPPASVDVFAGGTLALTLSATGLEPLRYQWSQNGVARPGQTNALLLWTNVPVTAAGAFVCEVANAHGSVRSPTTQVRVLAPTLPVILAGPRSATVYAGLPTTFSVVATGSAWFGYQWQFNGGDWPGATQSTLTLPAVQPAHAGAYRVIVSNPLGAVVSAPAILSVPVPPPDSLAAAVTAHRPVAFWRLNETSGSTVSDFAGGPPGVTRGGLTLGGIGLRPPDFPGLEMDNRAVAFDRPGDAIVTAGSPLNDRSGFTVSGWICPSSTEPSDEAGLWGQTGVMETGFRDANTLEARATRGGMVQAVYGFPPDEWHAVTVVADGTALRLYLDGRLVGAGGTPTSGYGRSTNAFVMGAGLSTFSSGGFNGGMDEVAVVDRALGADDVCTLVRAARRAALRLELRPGGNFVLDSKPVGPLRPAWNCGADWRASSGDARGMTRRGVMALSAPEADQIILPSAPEFNVARGTVMFWVRSRGVVGTGGLGAMLVDWRTVIGAIVVQTDDGRILVETTGGGVPGSLQSTAGISDDRWHHIAWVFDQSAGGTMAIHLDGELDRTQGNAGAWSWPAGEAIALGASTDPAGRPFDGLLDDVRFYGRPLTAAEIARVHGGDDHAVVGIDALAVRLNFDAAPTGLTLEWPCGTLQGTGDLPGGNAPGAWSNIAEGEWPFIFLPDGPQRFFRVAD